MRRCTRSRELGLEPIGEAGKRIEPDDARRIGNEVGELIDVVEVQPAVAVVDHVLDAAD